MSTQIICTVGTSLLSRVRRDRNIGSGERPDYREVLAEINRLESDDNRCGAEINSLESMFRRGKIGREKLEPPYTLVFLVSDTPDGAWSGKLLEAYSSSGLRKLDIEKVTVETIEGLQPDEPERFAKIGLRNLVKVACMHLSDYHKQHPGGVRVINATGGFKAQISFAGLIGQTVRVPVAYMFELFPYVIEMPPMPVEFSRELWLEHFDLFTTMSEEGQIETDDPQLHDTNPILLDLLDRIEMNGRYVFALSPILELMHWGFLIRPWPREVREPKPSGMQPRKKLKINESEMPHAPKGSRKRMEDLAELPWTTSVSNVKFADTRRSRIIHYKDPEKPDEIRLYHSDRDKALVVSLRTTCSDDGERIHCLRVLAEMLES